MRVDSQRREVKVKLAIVGIPSIGKGDILADWVRSQASAKYSTFQVGDAEVIKGDFLWEGIPKADWKLHAEVVSSHGWVGYSAIQDLILRKIDGLTFVAPVDPSRVEETRAFLIRIGEFFHRQGLSLRDFPVVIHYHGIERIPGFQAAMLDQFLGIPAEGVFHVETRSDGHDSLAAGFAFLMGEVVQRATDQIPSHEETQ